MSKDIRNCPQTGESCPRCKNDCYILKMVSYINNQPTGTDTTTIVLNTAEYMFQNGFSQLQVEAFTKLLFLPPITEADIQNTIIFYNFLNKFNTN